MKSNQPKKRFGLVRKLVISLVLVSGIAASAPVAANAGGKTGTVVLTPAGGGVQPQSVGWGGCGGCGQ